MQSAQKVITTYRRKRLLVCLGVGLLTFIATLCVRFILQHSLNQRHIESITGQMVTAMDKILLPMAAERTELQALTHSSCQDIHLSLRKRTATLQTVRSVALVRNGYVYCSSIFGSRHIAIHQLHPELPTAQPLLMFSTDRSLLKGTPVLMQWYPADNGADGVLMIVNIELLGELIFNAKSPLISDISLSVGNQSFLHNIGVVKGDGPAAKNVIYRQHSANFPFAIHISGPGASTTALHELPGELPLALVLSLLMGGISWLATATRMSFSREINLGITAREFEIWCQPLEDLHTRKCCGVEILLRWNNPRRGNIPPDVFIPIAEGYNLIVPLTRYVLAETARRLRSFPQDPHFHIGINVAARHFSDGQLLRDLHRYWFSARPVQQLMIELTERDALREGDHHIAEHLHFKGIRLAIDDFGTGNSSLSWLEKLRPDVLKIDKSFTAAIGVDNVNATVTDMIISLARRLKIATIAEGVETTEQRAYLRNLGVDQLQGFYYARPMPIDDFPLWLEKQQAG